MKSSTTFCRLILLSSCLLAVTGWQSSNQVQAGDTSVIPIAQQNMIRGQTLQLNGKTYPAAWIQWREGNSSRIALADTSAARLLGLELLSNNKPTIQPVSWFNLGNKSVLNLPAQIINNYRYLDITDILKATNWQISTQSNILVLNSPVATIQDVTVREQLDRREIIVKLDKPTPFRLSQNPQQAAVILDSDVSSAITRRFSPNPEISAPLAKEDELQLSDDNFLGDITPREKPALVVKKAENQSRLLIDLPPGNGAKVKTKNNHLLIEILPNPLSHKKIIWQPGITWHQRYIDISPTSFPSHLSGDRHSYLFPVVWLEVDLKSPAISLQPITSNRYSMTGTQPLLTMARENGVVAAINGGFFNRNNKLPLGVIRRANRWLSGAILNRGVIAWNQQGDISINRLTIQESILTGNGMRLPLAYLNSGYIQAGIARYSLAWGNAYIPLSDKETIVTVENETVTKKVFAPQAGSSQFPIPSQGYLLVIRGNQDYGRDFLVGQKVKLETRPLPQNLTNYPYMIGAGPLLVKNSQIILNPEAEKFSAAFQRQYASRSAIGINQTGKLIIVALHNRPGGKGANLPELAQVMLKLGAIEALNLDGGSSTSLYLGGELLDRSPVTAAPVHNGIGLFIGQ